MNISFRSSGTGWIFVNISFRSSGTGCIFVNISVICEPFFRTSGTGWIFVNILGICEPFQDQWYWVDICEHFSHCEPFSGPV